MQIKKERKKERKKKKENKKEEEKNPTTGPAVHLDLDFPSSHNVRCEKTAGREKHFL